MKSETELILVIPLILVLILAGGCMYDSLGNRTPEPAGTIDQPRSNRIFRIKSRIRVYYLSGF